MYFTLISAKTSFSFVNAAFTVSGVAVTVGHAFDARSFTSGEQTRRTWGRRSRRAASCVLHLDQVVDVRDADLCREARIDRAAARARAIQFLAGEIGVDDVFRGTPRPCRYALKNGAYTYAFSTRGMPMRSFARFFISSMRSCAAFVQPRAGIGSATTLGLRA